MSPLTPYPSPGNDTTNFGGSIQYVLVAVGGDLKVKDGHDAIKTLTVPAGIVPGPFNRVYSTGTTATGITAYA